MFDLDDTVIQAGSYVSPRVMDALAAAHDAGYLLSVASGRPVCDIHPAIIDSGVMDYAVCANGATVVRLVDNETIASALMTRADCLDCYSMLSPYRPAWNAFFDGKSYFEWKGASYMLTGRTGALARAQRYGSGTGTPVARVMRFLKRGFRYLGRMLGNPHHRQVLRIKKPLESAVNGVEKIGCTIVDPAHCAEAASLLRADGRFEVMQMGEHELEVTAAGVTKGTGAQVLMRAIGVAQECSVAFGDGGNDLPIVPAVGHFVAMGNADDRVKSVADELCPSVADDGVAIWIENMLDSGGLAAYLRGRSST